MKNIVEIKTHIHASTHTCTHTGIHRENELNNRTRERISKSGDRYKNIT